MKVLDLFCGAGGFTQGMMDADFDVVAGIDNNEKAIESYRANWSHHALCKDLTQFTPLDFVDETKITEIDVIVGGPPCQGFSNAGRRDPKDPRNSLFRNFVNYVDYFKPKFFIMENVIGILSMKTQTDERVVDLIIQSFSNYRCTPFKLYASDYGVPQNRRRVLFIGIRSDLGIEPSVPDPTTPVRPPVGHVLEPRDKVPMSCYLSQRAIDGINRRRMQMKQKSFGFGAQFLNLDKPSFTISARYWKDGYDALVKYDETSIRRLTIDEIKRIQSFPSTYKLEGSKKDKIMQLGNAVAPVFIFHIASHIKMIVE